MTSDQGKISRAVLVTGCSSGIGRATALALVRAGWPVWASARKPESLGALAEAGCRTLALDVTSAASITAAVQTIEAEHGAVGALVNNAGYSQSGAIEAVPIERVRAQFDTNFFGPVQLIQAVAPRMRAQGWGRIVNMSSMGGKLVFPGGGFYHATKYAIEAMSDALRFELRPFGIGVVLIEPGLIKSGFGDAAVGGLDGFAIDEVYRAFHGAVATSTKEVYEKGPLARLAGTPDDVAKAVLRALTVSRPRARYTVSLSAKLFLGQRRMLGDRGWDWLMRQSFPAPGTTREIAESPP
jgi:NAD(P)-dependent dehydrogenase (short-subunit alcohol dehydrogenase family)